MKKSIVRIISILITTISLNIVWIIQKGCIPYTRSIASVILSILVCLAIYFFDCKAKYSLVDLLNFKIKNIYISDIIAFLLITFLSLFLRYKLIPHESPDYIIFLSAWIKQIRNIGWHSLGCNIGNYSALYTESLIVLSMSRLPEIWVAKILSILFDYILGIIGVFFYKELNESPSHSGQVITYACIVLNPIVVLNSAAWGQCDVLYSSFAILSILFILKLINRKKINPELPLIFFSIAFCLKLQSVLILPFILFFIMTHKNKDLKITQFLWIPIIYLIAALPMLIAGRSLSDVLLIYFKQSNQYSSYLNMGYHNLFDLLGKNASEATTVYFYLGLILAVSFVACVYYIFFRREIDFTPENIMCLSCFTVLSMTFFLPSMHERYAYIAEILILLLATFKKKYIIPALITILCTLLTYGVYISDGPFILTQTEKILIALSRLGVIIYFLFNIFNKTTINAEYKRVTCKS